MKIIYIGQLPVKNAELVLGGIFKPTDIIYEGTIFEIPDENSELIQKTLLGGNYKEYIEPKKANRTKKEKEDIKEDK